MSIDNIFFGFVFPFVLFANVLWYFIKYVLSQNGYKTHLFYGHFNDFTNLHHLIRKEQDAKRKRFLIILLVAMYSLLPILVGAVLWTIRTQ